MTVGTESIGEKDMPDVGVHQMIVNFSNTQQNEEMIHNGCMFSKKKEARLMSLSKHSTVQVRFKVSQERSRIYTPDTWSAAY